MASYKQFCQQIAKSDAVRKLAWVCGEERVLVHDCVARLRARVKPDVVKISVGEVVWDELVEQSSERRLYVVHDAESIHDWEGLRRWRGEARWLDNWLVLVSGASKLDKERVPEQLASNGKGYRVACRRLTLEEIADWIQDRVPLTLDQARRVALRCESRLIDAQSFVWRAELLDLSELSDEVITELTPLPVASDFARLVLAGARISSFEAAGSMTREQVHSAVSLLDQRLDVLGPLHRDLRSGEQVQALAKRYGDRGWLVSILAPYAHAYPSSRVRHCRMLLAGVQGLIPVHPREAAQLLSALW